MHRHVGQFGIGLNTQRPIPGMVGGSDMLQIGGSKRLLQSSFDHPCRYTVPAEPFGSGCGQGFPILAEVFIG